jgi:hypothetical protein
MAGESTLIVTTRTGVRPLGVRGEPLHNAASQLSRVIRRRLGDAAADLLAEPQLHEDGKTLDWYAGWTGAVQRVADLDPTRRGEILSKVDLTLREIGRLGGTLTTAGSGDDIGVVGRSLQLAAKKPAESFVFLVGDRPVVVCWGYEKEAAASLMGPALPRAPEPVPTPVVARRSVLDAPPPLPAIPLRAAPATIPWFRALLVALPLLLLLLGGAWLLRELLPAEPNLAMATREGPPAPPAPPPPPDLTPAMKASLSSEEARAKALRLELAAIEGELRKRITDCKPPEVAKQEPPKELPKELPKEVPKPPPQVAAIPQPKPAPAPPPPAPTPRPRPPDGLMRMPAGPTNDYSFMQGCWRTDRFKHETNQMEFGVSSYCFDANGNGSLEWRRGRTACRTRARAQFNGPSLALRDSDSTCNDGSHWYADQLVCQRGADGVADCIGRSQGRSGPVSWRVNLHKIN